MPRNPDHARHRLQEAALALFHEHGYDRTTAAEIAARAGVTERTFFRHFPDKREVLFGGQGNLEAALTAAVTGLPDDGTPLDLLHRAFRSVAPTLESKRHFSAPRQALIDRTPALKERELAKIQSLTALLTGALADRGVPAARARLAAQVGTAIFAIVMDTWFADPAKPLAEAFDAAFADLADLSQPFARPPA
ncbi:MAG: helix-turn-helix domain-containing protein [Paracoccaceae bacterium]